MPERVALVMVQLVLCQYRKAVLLHQVATRLAADLQVVALIEKRVLMTGMVAVEDTWVAVEVHYHTVAPEPVPRAGLVH